MARLARDPAFAGSRSFVTFHLLGLLDFAIAVAAATLASGAFAGLVSGPITAAPLEVWAAQSLPELHRAHFHHPPCRGALEGARAAAGRTNAGWCGLADRLT